MIIYLCVCSICSVVKLKTLFETWKARNDVNGVYWYYFSYLITVMALVIKLTCDHKTPIFETNYCMFDWAVYRIFVLNKAWKRDSPQMMIFVYICSTCSVDKLKTRLETWIANNEIIGVYWFNFYYLITVLVLVIKLTCARNGHQVSKSNNLCLIGRSTDYLC
jgi:hypothetical protein